MAVDTNAQADASSVAHGHDDHGAHPSEVQYWMVFAILFVLTAIEVAWSYSGFEGVALWLPLVTMMIVKFLLVAGAFMHLYFDIKMLNGRLFTLAFAGSLTLAMAVYFAVFASFDMF